MFWQLKEAHSLAGKTTTTQTALLVKTGHDVKGFGLAVQQARLRAGKKSRVPAHRCTNPHAALWEQRACSSKSCPQV